MRHPVWLEHITSAFPPTHMALNAPNGLLAIGGDLSPNRLITAYSRGIFPWFNDDQPILWWSPNPRMVFIPGEVHQSKSLAKLLRQQDFSVTLDRNFDDVIDHCRQARLNHEGTWISPAIKKAYKTLHKMGYAHSIETRDANGQIIGGLYGIAIGGVFFGESMFSLAPNASKVAITQFSIWLAANNFALIDCQVENPHLVSLGGKNIKRAEFEAILTKHATPKRVQFQDFWAKHQGACIYPVYHHD